MARTRLSTKGQLIIPKEVRDRHGWSAGTELLVEDLGGAVIVREARTIGRTRPRDVIGCLRYTGKPKSLEDMERAIAAGALESR